ncbi:DUF2971 domain-containing protein [Hymenobacter coccineus]|uniref:DUF2971 domain-containing protein n=1 Tax=Hymenobacter coccineus TaxID=1908235 RepID=UPI000F78BE4A|nr:DUF2971 domain-containing protein [Hymenobacter coccineus]
MAIVDLETHNGNELFYSLSSYFFKLNLDMEPTIEKPQIDLDKLYHYSTPGGFNGILRSRSLWMTNIQYQNDIEEYKYATKLAFEVIKEDYPGINQTALFIDSNIVHIYTFSLTEQNDLLSQWRGYSPNGGFAFAFNKELLESVVKDNNLELVRCIYDKDEQKEYIRSKVIGMQPADFLEMQAKSAQVSHDNNTGEGYRYNMFIRGMRALTISYHAARLKHPKFAEEKEWRLIKRLSESEIDNVKLREGKDILIPYVEIPLVDKDKQIKFSSIIVGPGSRQDLAKQACSLILCDDIIASDIPYRNW